MSVLSQVGVGIDAVDVERMRLALGRTPRLAQRVFTDGERAYGDRFRDPSRQLAARFAAKEATMKALGVGIGAFAFRDVEVVRARSGAPSIAVHGGAAALAERRGVTEWQISMTHTDLIAQAIVIAFGPGVT